MNRPNICILKTPSRGHAQVNEEGAKALCSTFCFEHHCIHFHICFALASYFWQHEHTKKSLGTNILNYKTLFIL